MSLGQEMYRNHSKNPPVADSFLPHRGCGGLWTSPPLRLTSERLSYPRCHVCRYCGYWKGAVDSPVLKDVCLFCACCIYVWALCWLCRSLVCLECGWLFKTWFQKIVEASICVILERPSFYVRRLSIFNREIRSRNDLCRWSWQFLLIIDVTDQLDMAVECHMSIHSTNTWKGIPIKQLNKE